MAVRKALPRALALGLVAVLLASAAVAQRSRGRFVATVFDENGDPLQGVAVHVLLPEQGTTWDLETDRRGRFQFLPPDPNLEYEFRLEKAGYRPLEITIDIDVRAPRSFELVEQQGDPTAVEIYNEGAQRLAAGDLDAALERFDAALEVQPDLALGHLGRAAVFLEQDDHEAALDSARQALAHDPTNPEAIVATYETLLALGRVDEALGVVEALPASKPRSAARVLAARGEDVVVGPGRTVFSEVLDKALKEAKDDAEAHYLRGAIALSLNELPAAARHWERFAELAPEDPRAEGVRRQLLLIAD